MNRFTKIAGTSLLVISLAALVKNFKSVKSSLTKDQQLVNRLTEQLKISKQATSKLSKVLHKVNLSNLNHHFNDFNDKLQPRLKELQTYVKKIKQD